MKKGGIKRILSIFSAIILLAMSWNVFAVTSTVWTITITDTTGNPITSTANINWDWTFAWTNNWSWSITWIKVTATVNPLVNMNISKSLIALWNITGVTWSGTLDVSIWTNSATWVSVKVKSQNWWLLHSSWTGTINNNISGWSYKFFGTNNDAPAGTTTFALSAWKEINTLNQTETFYTNTTVEDLYTNTSPQKSDITFKVSALAPASAKAWNYQDILTFFVISNF